MRKITVLVTLIILSQVSFSYALNVETHKAINEYIANNSLNGFSLDSYLKSQLELQSGVDEKFNSLEVWKWLRDGGEYEDIPAWYMPYLRSVNHFHNPINEQGFSGIWGTGFASGESAILWSQRAIGTQSPGGYYSWLDVRDYYYKALISNTKTERDTNFAQTFRGMGQVMHLVQDMSVPEHSRNDGHYLPTYEEYVRDNSTVLSAAIQSPFFFNISALSQLSVFPNAPVPIANLFDTNQYDGTNPNIVVGNTIGLSEYSNANFVSPQTLFKDFTYPSKNTSVQVVDYDYPDPFNPGNYVKRQYYKKVADGETGLDTNGDGIPDGYRLAGVDYLKLYRDSTLSSTQADQIMVIPPMDNYVYSDYASLLLPRAVGYSAGLLNYFFRGTLEITAPDSYVYSIIDGSNNPQQFTKIKAKVRNTTPNEQMQAGVLQAVAKYKKRTDYAPDLSTDPPTQTSREPEYSYSVSAAIPITSLDSINPQEFTFNFENNPIPAGITDLYLFVVYKGTLGNEADNAIAVGMKDIKEPTHHVIWNLTDRFSLGIYDDTTSTWTWNLYTAEDIKADPDLAKLVDLNNNKIFSEPGEPYIDPYDIKFEISYMESLSQEPVGPLAEVQLSPGRYIRLIVIVDSKYNNYVRIRWLNNINNKIEIGSDDLAFEGVINQEWENGAWQPPTPVTTFRSIRQHFDQGILRCKPSAINPVTGYRFCPYPKEQEPVPADTTPQTAKINFE